MIWCVFIGRELRAAGVRTRPRRTPPYTSEPLESRCSPPPMNIRNIKCVDSILGGNMISNSRDQAQGRRRGVWATGLFTICTHATSKSGILGLRPQAEGFPLPDHNLARRTPARAPNPAVLPSGFCFTYGVHHLRGEGRMALLYILIECSPLPDINLFRQTLFNGYFSIRFVRRWRSPPQPGFSRLARGPNAQDSNFDVCLGYSFPARRRRRAVVVRAMSASRVGIE
ncbi:hypothetical protein EVAR_56186_1 [Eumeta japonica]|uniref:Uncharacterized protein n=1 Tax=Eumeta variegata TaxID=151549 RepID=A0A4C1ZTG5_EUMVA|nr:hypothetical protein EVAR_56186_1 [Eumeta japonica]